MLKLRLKPKQSEFFELFRGMAQDLIDITNVYSRLAHNFKDLEVYTQEAEEIEHRSDDKAEQIIHKVNSSFITPLDPEDIYQLAHELDDVTDKVESVIHNCADCMPLELPEFFSDFTGMLILASGCISLLVGGLEKQKKSPELQKLIKRIHDVEREADKVYRSWKRKIRNEEKDPIMFVIKMRLLDGLESAMDTSKRVSNIIGRITVK